MDYLRQLGPTGRDPKMQKQQDRTRWNFDFTHLDQGEVTQKIIDCMNDLGPRGWEVFEEEGISPHSDGKKEGTSPNYDLPQGENPELTIRRLLAEADKDTHEKIHKALLHKIDTVRLEQVLRPQFEEELNELDFPGFGKIRVIHGDILSLKDEESDGTLTRSHQMLIPMVPNMRPSWGLSLEIFNHGGENFVKNAFEAAAQDKEPCLGDCYNVNGFPVQREGSERKSEQMVRFFRMPMYFHGDPADQKVALRAAIKRAFTSTVSDLVERRRLRDDEKPTRKADTSPLPIICLPHVASGYYGYDPYLSARVLVEEAIDAILQVDVSSKADLALHEHEILFIDRDYNNFRLLYDALETAKRRYKPDERVQPSVQYWADKTRQLIMLPDRPYQFLRQQSTKFKKYHGVVRNSRETYLNNIKPFFWRAARVRLPPQLLMRKESPITNPEISVKQAPPQPYYFRGVSHVLFPKTKSTFTTLRAASSGWRGMSRQYRLREDTRPRM